MAPRANPEMNGNGSAEQVAAHLNQVAVAVPENDIHEAYMAVVAERLDAREARLFRRMASRAGISHRYSFFAPGEATGAAADAQGFFKHGAYPGTAARMARYERDAPALALGAIDGLDFKAGDITHIVVASCTGFMAPGLDQVIVERAGLNPSVERTVVGFMGCYAAVNALRLAHHIVRSEPRARVLTVNLELCSLHFQETGDLEQNLSSMLFGDGAAAAIVSADETGAALNDFRSVAIPGSGDLITWRIGDSGFDMHLSGQVPRQIEAAMRSEIERNGDDGILRGARPDDFGLWAVHAGGRTILDAVEKGLELPKTALDYSRGVLNDFGNMSSATLMFVMAHILKSDAPNGTEGLGIAFGPGLAAESFRFTRL